MLNLDIYNSAFRFISQGIYDSSTEDFLERAPYLIASFCCSAKSIDRSLRKDEGLEEQKSFSPVFLPLSEEFPLCSTLAAPAALYVAAMLMIEEDPELSDSLYDKYCDSIAPLSAIHQAICDSSKNRASCESIVEKYFFD